MAAAMLSSDDLNQVLIYTLAASILHFTWAKMIQFWLWVVLAVQQAVAFTSRCYYGQSCFPSQSQLSTFNSSIGGGLISIRPIRAGCYKGPEYNDAACQDVNKNAMNNAWRCVYLWSTLDRIWSWKYSKRSDHIAAYQQINFENCGTETCVPTLSNTCQQGSIPRFGVVAKSSSDVVAAVKFATKFNLKIVIKNPGHDVCWMFWRPFALWYRTFATIVQGPIVQPEFISHLDT